MVFEYRSLTSYYTDTGMPYLLLKCLTITLTYFYIFIPTDAVPLPSTSLESLHKDTLYISESSLSNVTKIGEGIIIIL